MTASEQLNNSMLRGPDLNATKSYCQVQSHSICDQVDVMVIDSLTSSISVVVNTIHLMIITRYSTPSNNRVTIINLSVLDLIRALVVVILSNCPAQNLLYQIPKLCTLSTIINDATITITLVLLSMAAIDRCIAVCQPFRYTSHILTRNYSRLLASTWVFVTAYVSIQNSMLDACVLGSKMCGVSSTKPIFLLYLVLAFLLCGTSLLIVLLCFSKIIMEFHKMADAYRNEARESRRMSRLLGLVAAVFYIFYLPLVLGIIVALCGMELENRAWNYFYTLVTLNGIFNTVAYGWLKKKYRTHLMEILCWSCSRHSTCKVVQGNASELTPQTNT